MLSETQPNVTPRTIVSAADPEFAEADGSKISLKVTFKEISDLGPIPFIADKNDPELHGREIYELAVNGRFGEVAAYSPPLQQPQS
jgi:hypothetical protein